MQFSARLEFNISAQTAKFCRKLDLSELPRERIFEEFRKLILKAKRPSIGLRAAKQLGVLNYFPELKALIGVPQDPKWHPEGDVWTHTLMVLDEAARLRTGIEKKDMVLMFGALCHDFGKPLTTKFLRGRWRSPSHDTDGIAPTLQFLQRLTDDRDLIKVPRPLLMGKHLLKLGMSPGPEIGKILKLAFEKQLNGDLQTNEQAISWAKSNYPDLTAIA